MASYLLDQDKFIKAIPDFVNEIGNHYLLMRVEGQPQNQPFVVVIGVTNIWNLFFMDLIAFGRVAWFVSDKNTHGPWTLRDFEPKDFKLSQSHPRQYQVTRIRRRN